MASARFYEPLSRTADVIVALSGLAVSAPILGLVAAAIAVDSGRPILYKGLRVGRGGKPFLMVKFRTMVRSADKLGSSITRDSDNRVTRLGAFLRRSKLDELPQLWNVLKGEMSVVGPRPDTPEIIQTYTPAMRRALDVRPGITSVASLWLRNETDLLRGVESPDEIYAAILVPAKVELALKHLDRRSLRFDWGILIATVGAWLRLRRPDKTEQQFLGQLRRQIAAYKPQGGNQSPEPECPMKSSGAS